MTREQYAEEIVYNLSAEEILRMFGISEEEVINGKWNQNLEIAYWEYMEEEGLV